MDYYDLSLKKKIGLVLFVGTAMLVGALLFRKQRSKGCPIECWYREQEARQQSETGTVKDAADKRSNNEKP